MHKKTEDLLFIEKCFGEIKSKNNVNDNISKIERTLKRMFDIEFEISISQNDTHKFFGMNIYPQVSTMDAMVESILKDEADTETIVKLWQTNKKWYLELDSILLYDRSLNANPAEIVAILLHEVGHVIYSNTIPQRLNRILRFKIMKLNYQMRKLIANEKIRKIFNLTIVESCTSKNFTYINENKERIADKFVINYGYAEDLDNFIDKLIQTQGNGLVNRSDKEVENDITIIVNWTVTNIKELEFRKSGLKSALKVEMLKSPSEFIKKTIQDIRTTFFGESTDKYRELLSEQYTGETHDVVSEIEGEQILVNHVKRILREANDSIFDNLGKVKKIHQSDIDILRIELEKIENNDDKIYLLDRVYGQLDLVNASLDLIEIGKDRKVSQSKSTLLRMKEELEDIRAQVLAMKIVDKEYGVFIRYPKGYQG